MRHSRVVEKVRKSTMAESTVRQRLEEDLKSAMRAGDTVSRDAIRYILSAVKNAEIDARGSALQPTR